MKNLKFRVWLFCAGLLCLCACNKEPAAKLVMATNAAFPPYEFVSGQKIDGIDPEIIRRIADRLGYELVIQDMSFDSVILSVQQGKADVAASGITITEERKKQVLFTVPYVTAEQVVLVDRDSPIHQVSDFENAVFKRGIGVQHGTTGDLYVTEHFKNAVHRFRDGAVAVAALKSGKQRHCRNRSANLTHSSDSAAHGAGHAKRRFSIHTKQIRISSKYGLTAIKS